MNPSLSLKYLIRLAHGYMCGYEIHTSATAGDSRLTRSIPNGSSSWARKVYPSCRSLQLLARHEGTACVNEREDNKRIKRGQLN